MQNRFTVTIEFSYKGDTFELTADVDLDRHMEELGGIASLHDLVAKRNGIDSFSYQYEVLTSEELQFSQVEGFAGEFIHDNEFDADGFALRWHEERINQRLAAIAQRVLGITDLTSQPSLQQALREAYRAGQAKPLPEVIR